MKGIKQTAKRFAKDAKIGSFMRYGTLERKISENGWRLRPYSKSGNYFKKHDLNEYAEKRRAFAYVQGDKIAIFYRDNLPYIFKLLLIYHEIAHIVLGHTVCDGIVGKSDDAMEQDIFEDEADIFASALLRYRVTDTKTVGSVIIFLILISILYLYNPLFNRVQTAFNEPSTTTTEAPADTIYIQQALIEETAATTTKPQPPQTTTSQITTTFKETTAVTTTPEPTQWTTTETPATTTPAKTSEITTAATTKPPETTAATTTTTKTTQPTTPSSISTKTQTEQSTTKTTTPATQNVTRTEAAANARAVIETEKSDNIVYRSSTFKVYHRITCQYVRNTCVEIDRDDAIAIGMTPCKVCKPG